MYQTVVKKTNRVRLKKTCNLQNIWVYLGYCWFGDANWYTVPFISQKHQINDCSLWRCRTEAEQGLTGMFLGQTDRILKMNVFNKCRWTFLVRGRIKRYVCLWTMMYCFNFLFQLGKSSKWLIHKNSWNMWILSDFVEHSIQYSIQNRTALFVFPKLSVSSWTQRHWTN